ncbi:hypothetical protein AB0I22_12855 [Streptomyces sp. NPDC050610]|uniref:hypothetical protein n=1 Tax=Streptomyces sp. NPDC050610 TaxID=3157097 RepID=UPI00343D8552
MTPAMTDQIAHISELFPHGAVPAREDFGLTLSPDRRSAWSGAGRGACPMTYVMDGS